MANTSITLQQFLEQLASQRGLHRRVRLIGRYWKQVQGLSADDRQRVALAFGSEAAWNRLEKLFARDGTLSDGEMVVKRALDSIGEADPAELRALAGKVRTGNYSEAGKELAELVGGALDEAGDLEDESVPFVPLDGGVAGTERVSEVEPEPAVDREPQADPTVEPGQGARVEAEAEAEAKPDAEAEGGRDDEAEAERDAQAEAERDAEAGPESREVDAVAAAVGARDPAFDPEPPKALEPREEVAPAPGVDRESTTAEGGFEAAVSTPSAAKALSAAERLRELRRLRDTAGFGERLGRDGREKLLARLGSGWSARRALSQLILAGDVDGVEEAVDLTRRLETSAQMTWCLGDLVEHWELGDAELAKVLEAAPTQASKRRLQRRAERRRPAS